MTRLLVVLTCLLFLTAQQRLQGVTIDDFQAGAMSAYASPGTAVGRSFQEHLPLEHVIGGRRALIFSARTHPHATPPVDSRVSISVEADGGLAYLADSGVSAVNWKLVYGRSGSPRPGDIAWDLTVDGGDALLLDFSSAEFLGDAGFLDVYLWSANGFKYDYVGIPNSLEPFAIALPLEAHDSRFDPTQVTGITIGTDNGNLYGKFVLESIRTVPEPSTSLTLVALAMLHAKRREARNKCVHWSGRTVRV